jgi:hypothetical protein
MQYLNGRGDERAGSLPKGRFRIRTTSDPVGTRFLGAGQFAIRTISKAIGTRRRQTDNFILIDGHGIRVGTHPRAPVAFVFDRERS